MYKINWLERKTTSTGKDKADVTLEKDGVKTEVTIWGDFPNFANLAPGMEIEGEIKPSSDPKYKPSFNAPRTSKTAPGGGFKSKMMEEAMVRKETSIAKFQATKEESIRLAGCQRDAVLLTQTMVGSNIALDPILSPDEKRAILKKEVIKWRDWLYSSAEFNEVLPFE